MIGGNDEDEIDDRMDVDEFEAPANNPWLNQQRRPMDLNSTTSAQELERAIAASMQQHHRQPVDEEEEFARILEQSKHYK